MSRGLVPNGRDGGYLTGPRADGGAHPTCRKVGQKQVGVNNILYLSQCERKKNSRLDRSWSGIVEMTISSVLDQEAKTDQEDGMD